MTPLALGAIAASLALLAAPLTSTSARAPVEPESRTTAGAHVDTARADWPISPAQVLDPFDDPLPYAAGHRGVDLAAAPEQTVRAALPGRVAVAGYVAGRPLVVIKHHGDRRTTYLPVIASVSVGDYVLAGEPIGRVDPAAASQHCVAAPCLHWGARRGESYIDPLSLLSPLAGPIVLLPEP